MKTNEELARSLCCSGCNKYQCYTDNGSCVNLKNLIMMAEYKDKQFEELINGLPSPILELITTLANK